MLSLGRTFGGINPYTAMIGLSSVLFLFWASRGLKPMLRRFGFGERAVDILGKLGPAVIIVATTIAVSGFGLHARGVGILGAVPRDLPQFKFPAFDGVLWMKIVAPSLLIGIVGYVESISVALTLAAKRRQRIEPTRS